MRITRCHIEGFGQFEKFSLDGIDHPLVVVLGPNEAGKTTLFQFMVTMLYGFSPAEAARHPFLPRDGHSLGGSLAFRSGKSRCSVERRLRSTPKGVLSIGSEGLFGTRESIRNRPLSVTGDVPREVYEAVYALTLHDMVHVSGRAWNSIQDRLLGGLNLDSLRIAREVAEEVETEAKKLWRPDRRGRTEDQILREQLRELRAAVREARERDVRIRDLSRQIEGIAEDIRRNEEESRSLRRAKSRAERLLPVRARLERVEHLERQAGDLAELECMPEDPGRRLEELESEVEEIDRQAADLREAIRAHEEAVSALTPADEALAAAASEIRTWHSRLALFTQRRLEIDRADTRLQQLGTKRAELVSRLVTAGWSETTESAVRSISSADLREAVRRYTKSREEADLARARREGVSLQVTPGSPGVWWVVLATAVILGATGLVIGEPVVWGPAMAVATLATGFLLQALSTTRGTSPDSARPGEGAEERLRHAHRQVLHVLGDFQLSEVRRRDPDPELASDVQALQAILVEIDAEKTAVSTLKARLAEDEGELLQLLRRVGNDTTESPDARLGRLFDRLGDVESRRATAEQASAFIPENEQRLRQLSARREELQQSQADLRNRLAELGGGDYFRGIEISVERRRAAERAATIREELEAGHPDLPAVIAEIRERTDELPKSQEEAADLDDAIEDLARTLQEDHARMAGLRATVESQLEEKTVADIESEVSLVEMDLGRVRRNRDRLLLLASIIRHADTRFRDRHQPDVIRRASDVVRRLTNARYSGIEVDDQDGSLTIREESHGVRYRVGSPLSRGTLDQVYLSLRLGLADHLDSAGDRLPLFLDEVLVNWDSVRRRAACKLLSELASSRQIFFFTCHEWLADEMAHLSGAHTVKL